jgi:predicted nucleotidyltransferase
VKELYAFGSVVRDDFAKNSDVDLLYNFDYTGFDFTAHPKEWLFSPYDEFFELKFSIEKLLKRKVDLISYKDIRNKYFKEIVDEEKILLYAKAEPEFVSAGHY